MLKIITDLKRRIRERNNPLTAEYAYTLRKYDRKLTEEQVFHRAVETINNNIKDRNSSCTLFEYDSTYPNMKNALINYYVNLGYYVLPIDTDAHIKQPKLLIVWER